MSSYNGWTNRETWLVNLWITNDEWSYNMVTELSHDELADGGSPSAAADSLSNWVEENCLGDQDTSGLAADLLNCAMAGVDWREIVENLHADCGVCDEC